MNDKSKNINCKPCTDTSAQQEEQWVHSLRQRFDGQVVPVPDALWDNIEQALDAGAEVPLLDEDVCFSPSEEGTFLVGEDTEESVDKVISMRDWKVAVRWVAAVAACALLIYLPYIYSGWGSDEQPSLASGEPSHNGRHVAQTGDATMRAHASSSVSPAEDVAVKTAPADNPKQIASACDSKKFSSTDDSKQVISSDDAGTLVASVDHSSAKETPVDVAQNNNDVADGKTSGYETPQVVPNDRAPMAQNTDRLPERSAYDQHVNEQLELMAADVMRHRSGAHHDGISLALSTGYGTSDASYNYGTTTGPSASLFSMGGESLTFLEASTQEQVKVVHQRPLRVTLAVKYPLSNRLSAETGLSYAYLASELGAGDEDGGYKSSQKVYDIGIPLALSYRCFERGNFSLYGKIGGMVDFSLSAKSTTDYYVGQKMVRHEKEDLGNLRPVWSLFGAVGAEYCVARQFSLFFEPQLHYGFNNHATVKTYLNDNRWEANLNVGLRMTIDR